MGSTPKFNLPWPEQVEGNDVSDDLRQLAAATEDGLQAAGRLVTTRHTASGTWTKPVGALWVEVEGWGGGGCSSRMNTTNSSAQSAGGGAGGKATVRIPASALPATVPLTVGAGATSPEQDGGDSTFGTYLLAPGGKSGTEENNSTPQGIGGGTLIVGLGASTSYVSLPETGGGRARSDSIYGGGAGASRRYGLPVGTSGGDGAGTGIPATGGGVGGTPGSLNGGAGASRTSGPSGGGGGGAGAKSADGTTGGNGGPGGTPGGGGGGPADGTVATGTPGPGGRGEIRVHVICVGK